MILKGPFVQLVKKFFDSKFGEKDRHCIRIRGKYVVNDGEVLALCRSCDDRIEKELAPLVEELKGPSTISRVVRISVYRTSKGRFTVYIDFSKTIKLFFIPIPRYPWISIVDRDDGTYVIHAHKSLNDFLVYLNNIGIEVPTNIFELHEKLSMFESDFANLIMSIVPKPRAVIEGQLVVRGKGRHQKYVLEANLTYNDVKNFNLSIGSRYTIIVYD